jgi:hypothetical protein
LWHGIARLIREGHGNQKNPFPNTTSRTDVRKARMSLFGAKKKQNKQEKRRRLERELLCHFRTV